MRPLQAVANNKKIVAEDFLRRPMRRQMRVANVGVANTFCDRKTAVANYLQPPNLLIATVILLSQKSLKNAYKVLATIFLPSQKKTKKNTYNHICIYSNIIYNKYKVIFVTILILKYYFPSLPPTKLSFFNKKKNVQTKYKILYMSQTPATYYKLCSY